MNIIQVFAGLSLLGGLAPPLWAASTVAIGPAQPLPDSALTNSFAAHPFVAGSSALVPWVATDAPARAIESFESTPDLGAPNGKSLDDLQFLRQATENGRLETAAAREAIPQLKESQLRQIAGLLVADHKAASERLANIAEMKGWTLPAPSSPAVPLSGTAHTDFDARWTADMIASHERSAALYRAQIQSGEDKELRGYARDTLPTIERHLAQLRSLQK